jgi:hypothetical protein
MGDSKPQADWVSRTVVVIVDGEEYEVVVEEVADSGIVSPAD